MLAFLPSKPRRSFSVPCNLLQRFSKPVHIQVSAGSGSCGGNQIVIDTELQAGASTPQQDFDENQNVVCWRRTANPDNDHGEMSEWGSFFPNDQNRPAYIDVSKS